MNFGSEMSVNMSITLNFLSDLLVCIIYNGKSYRDETQAVNSASGSGGQMSNFDNYLK